MSAPTPKGYQQDAVENVLEIFRHAESQLQVSTDESSRLAAIAHNGSALLEAPTGSGKTLMAGLIAQAFSQPEHKFNPRIVWFWFTPFAGLVEQTKASIKESFAALRIRDLYSNRVTGTARSGDVFVTTWASVATAKKDSRIVRTNGDTSVALDDFLDELRNEGFRIGTVIDEAHHGFVKATEAVKFYRQILRPDFTLLITATPDDEDVAKFKSVAGIADLHRIRVSRKDSVDAGLIKDGVKSIAYLVPDDQKEIADISLTAINDGWQMHNAVKDMLQASDINLTPLMLVQVGNSDKAVDEAKMKLKAAGVPEEKIAWYTSEDPNDDLLVVAKDESKEVLIFKVAVALGFDAPRAFTLVSMRGARDTDFGIQVVGRILRVHHRLQTKALNKTLPEMLRFGYVFLADAESQTGLTSAGDKINSIQTELSKISPYTMIVSVAGKQEVQVTQNGQAALISMPYKMPEWHPQPTPVTEGAPTLNGFGMPTQPTGLLTNLVLTASPSPLDEKTSPAAPAAKTPPPLPSNRQYPIKPGIPRVFRTERLPLSTDALLKCIQATIGIDDKVFNAGLRKTVKITRQSLDIFDVNHDAEVDSVQARLSDYEIARRAQGVLFDADYLHPKQLHQALAERLKKEFDHRGIDADGQDINRSLNLIIATYPFLIRKAARHCAAKFKEILDAAPILDTVEFPPSVQKSLRNIYGVMPQDLNEHERKFAELLDADTTGTVEWWFRNEPRKPWSVGIVLPNGDRYFPDFAIKVADRSKGDGIVLVEIKGNHILNGDDTLDKVSAEHKTYGTPIMLVREDTGRFLTVRYNEKTDKNVLDQIFRVENLVGY